MIDQSSLRAHRAHVIAKRLVGAPSVRRQAIGPMDRVILLYSRCVRRCESCGWFERVLLEGGYSPFKMVEVPEDATPATQPVPQVVQP